MPDTIHGQIYTKSPQKTQQTLYDRHLSYSDQSSFRIWIPKPSDISHKPQISIAISNGKARAFASTDLPSFTIWLQHLNAIQRDLDAPWVAALQITELLHYADQAAFEVLRTQLPDHTKELPNYQPFLKTPQN